MPTSKINRVIDLSHHNTVNSWPMVVNSGIAGVIHKATQGTGLIDSQYMARVKPIRGHGMMAGAYHFGTNADGRAQARHFIDTVKPDRRTLLALDLEDNKGSGGTMTLIQAKAFVMYVREALARWPLLYSGNLIKEMLGKTRDPILGNCPLWVPRYGPEPTVQPTWEHWTLWQYTEEGEVPGISGNVDRNKFNGDIHALRKLWNYPLLDSTDEDRL